MYGNRKAWFKYLLVIVAIGLLVPVLAVCNGGYSTTSTPKSSPSPVTTSANGQSVTVNLAADNIAFDQSVITVPAGAAVKIVFNNKQRIPHDFAAYETSAATTEIFVGEIITGPQTITYEFTAPAKPGTYFFRCDVHPGRMTGKLVVE